MKKIKQILFGLLMLLAGHVSAQDALYVYRNDGDFNAFLRADIDSMTCSRMDMDSVWHADWQTQVIYTPDSVYRIPLAAIDSVSLVTPEPKFRERLFHLGAAHLPYLQAVADNRLVFAAATPAELLPAVGQVVVSDVYDEPLGNGFAGRLLAVRDSSDTRVLDFGGVVLTDIYERLVTVGKSVSAAEEGPSQAPPQRVFGTGSNRFRLGAFTVPMGPVSLEVRPDVVFNYVICIGEHNLKNVIKLDYVHSYDMTAQLSARVDGVYTPEPKWVVDVTIPTPVAGLRGNLKLGGFCLLAGQMDLSASVPAHVSYRTGLLWQEGMGGPTFVHQQLKPLTITGRPEFSVNLNGSAAAGVAVRLGVNFINDKLMGLDVTGKLGLQLKARFALTDAGLEDGTLYASLKDATLATGLYGELAGGYTWAGVHSGMTLPSADSHRQPVSLQWEYPLYDQYLLPAFTRPEVVDTEENTRAVVKTRVSRDLCFFQPPVQLGLALYDKDRNLVETQYFNVNYKYERDWPYTEMVKEFKNLTPGKMYVARPVLRVYGKEMVAAPSSEFSTAIRVETGGASGIGKTSATVSGYADGLESAEMLCELGVVYGTTPGVEFGTGQYVSSGKKASGDFTVQLTGLKDSTLYYYRTCLALDGEYYYGEARSFMTKEKGSTPGEAIDLGLSVKWASHNVGASSPEEYGGYYAWGETEEKEVYNKDTYAYYNSRIGYIYIGDNISGTEYDVARVKWGGSWRMPTLDEIYELLENCSWEWTTYKGVNGRLITGSNGNSIFLPAAGLRLREDLYHVGSVGYYWSGKHDVGDQARDLEFHLGHWYGFWQLPYEGVTVRPVTE